jgi:hypothetical protein
MNKQQAIEVLKAHNEWRRDKGDTKNLTMHEPKVIGEAIDVAIAALSEPVTLPDGWVSVADGLPEMNKVVMVYIPDFEGYQIQLSEWVEYYEAPVSFSTATIKTGEGWADHDFDEITHWMSLPAAPTCEKEKG